MLHSIGIPRIRRHYKTYQLRRVCQVRYVILYPEDFIQIGGRSVDRYRYIYRMLRLYRVTKLNRSRRSRYTRDPYIRLTSVTDRVYLG